MTRSTWVARDVRAGCHTCHGGDARWFHKGAQGTAAQHTDATGHETWVEVSLHVTYTDGDPPQYGRVKEKT